MIGPEEKAAFLERHRTIVRKTLSAVSFLYAGFSLVLGLSIITAGRGGAATGLSAPSTIGKLMAGHALLLALAGAALWRPRRGAWAFTLLAAAASVAFCAFWIDRGSWQSALIDGFYPLTAIVLWLEGRRRA